MGDKTTNRGHSAVQEISGRILTFRYVIALTIMALLAITSHVSFDRVLSEHAGSSYLHQISNQQQLLIQRAARHALQYAAGDAAAKQRLERTMAGLETSHAELMANVRADGLPERASAALSGLYFAENGLDSQVQHFIGTARTVMSLQPDTPQLRSAVSELVSEADGDLYKGLQYIVLAYERSSAQELQRLQRMQNSLLVVVFLTLAMEAAIIFQPMVRRIMRYTGELLHLASTDSLTGLLNRRTFVERAFEKARAARRDGRPSCLLVMDADGFKRINDTHGHAIGDDVLKAMSERLSSRIRKEDVLGRIGGEEFALLLPDTRVEAARQLAERLRSAIEELEILTPDGPIRFTMSVGVSAIRFDEGDLTAALARADRALYEAKASGRNRVEVSQDLPDDEETASFKPAPA